jgi:hypothetical protein
MRTNADEEYRSALVCARPRPISEKVKPQRRYNGADHWNELIEQQGKPQQCVS